MNHELLNRCLVELRAFGLIFVLHKNNSDIEKVMVWVFLLAWGVITIGIAFEEAVNTQIYTMLTALVWMLIGRVWGREFEMVKDL